MVLHTFKEPNIVPVSSKLSVILIVKSQNWIIKQIRYSSILFSIKSSTRPVKKQLCVPDRAAHQILCSGQSLPSALNVRLKVHLHFQRCSFFFPGADVYTSRYVQRNKFFVGCGCRDPDYSISAGHQTTHWWLQREHQVWILVFEHKIRLILDLLVFGSWTCFLS